MARQRLLIRTVRFTLSEVVTALGLAKASVQLLKNTASRLAKDWHFKVVLLLLSDR